MARRRYYRSRKQAPLSEGYFIIALIAVVLVGLLLFKADDQQWNLIIIFSAIFAVALLGLFILISLMKRRKNDALARALAISKVDTLTGIEFENYIAAIFRHQGYKVQDTPKSGDFGVDLIITKDGQKTAVQVKRYNKSVNQAAVREVVAGNAMSYYRAEKTMVVTNSYFTKSVYQLAAAHHCELVDRDVLAVWIKEFQNQ